MKAIIYNDFVYNRKLIFWYFFLTLFYAVIFVPQDNIITTIVLSLMFATTYLLNILTENFQSGWYTFLLTITKKRSDLIKNLFIEAGLLTLLTLCFSLVIIIIIALIFKSTLLSILRPYFLFVLGFFILINLLVQSLDIYVSFKYGIKLARTVSVIIYLITIIITIFISVVIQTIINNSINIIESLIPIIVIASIMLLIGIIVVYNLTVKVVNKKDF